MVELRLRCLRLRSRSCSSSSSKVLCRARLDSADQSFLLTDMLPSPAAAACRAQCSAAHLQPLPAPDLRLARRSMDTLCLEPSRARSMASAETRTRRRGGRLNFPRRSSTFSFRSLICRSEGARLCGRNARPRALLLWIYLLGFQLEPSYKSCGLQARPSEVLRISYPFPSNQHTR